MPDQFAHVWQYPLLKLADGAVITLNQITIALLVAMVGLFAARLLGKLVERNLIHANVGVEAARTVRKIVFFGLAVVVALTTLRLLQIPITALTFLSGAIAVGLGFGAQNIINNFISGWILMSERPVRVGDFIEVEGSKGVVEDVGNRCTRIRRTDGVHILVPNSQMLERTVINWTLVDRDIRNTLRVGVAYGSPTRKVEQLILQAITEHGDIKQTPSPLVVFEDFGDNALTFDAYFWCEVLGERELRQIRSDLRHRITELFAQAAITIAFPQRDLHLDTISPLEVHINNATDTLVKGDKQ